MPESAPAAALAVDLDGALGDTRPLWDDWLAGSARLLGADPAALPSDRGEAAAALDASGAGNWRTLLGRFAEDHAPVYLRPRADVSAALRALASAGARIGVFTDAPEELARIALGQLGAARRVEALTCGTGALERLLDDLGEGTTVARTRDELLSAPPHVAGLRR
jgi:phosphoglycolate phosphatase-like HAD superfamily hydrolase